MPKESLSVWLGLGKSIAIGPKELMLMPVPLYQLRKVMDSLQKSVEENVVKTFKAAGNSPPDLAKMVFSLLGKIDVSDACYHLFADPKDPEGNSVNPGLSPEFFEQYLDIPTVQKLVLLFIEVNELDELLKNLERLPMVRRLKETLKMTFGQLSSSSLEPNMGSPPSGSPDSPSLKSTDTLRDTIVEQLENRPTSVQ